MSREVILHRVAPMTTVQDLGREGYLAQGVSRGGAVDRLALYEGAALLGQSPDCAVIEMAAGGGCFTVSEPVRFALTGAPMRAALGGRVLDWNASGLLRPGERLEIGAFQNGHFGYLSLAGGIDLPPVLGSRSTALSCGIGRPLIAGQRLPLGPDPMCADPPGAPPVAQRLAPPDRTVGGTLRFVAGPQTGMFPPAVRDRFSTTVFRRTLKGDRQGLHLAFDGAPFATGDQLAGLSGPITPGDIQMTGLGVPVVLLADCQTVGGYPRIGTIIPTDLPWIVQAGLTADLRFQQVSREEALALCPPVAARMREIRTRLSPLVREPPSTRDLLSAQLISGVVTGWEDADA